MKRFLALLLCAALLCACTALAAAETDTVKIGSGTAKIVTVPMGGGVSADVALAQGAISRDQNAAEIVQDAAAKGELLVAVNGGYFNAYYEKQPEEGYGKAARCQVNLIRDGRVINGGAGDQTAIYLGFTRDGRALIDEVAITLYVEYDGKKEPTWGVNQYYPEPNSLLLFTPEAGADLPVPANAKVAKIVGGKVTGILDSGKMVCAPDTYYFVCGKDLHDRLPAVGASVTFSTTFDKSAWSNVSTAVSCGPWLLHDGKNVFSENSRFPYLADQKVSETAVAQRTFAAVLAGDKLVLGTCSASPKQITDYLVSIGARDAMLLDGGASSMLYADGKMLTSAGRKLNNVICIYGASAPAVPTVGVSVNGKAVRWTDAAPFIDANDRTMVPLRAVGDALGLTVSWNGEKREASFTGSGRTLTFPIDGVEARGSDGKTVKMDTAAVIVNDRTYAPVRYLAEYFGYSVGWDAATRTVLITGK